MRGNAGASNVIDRARAGAKYSRSHSGFCALPPIGIGGTNPSAVGAAEGIGGVLFTVGSWMNSRAEYPRHVGKQRAENHGDSTQRGYSRTQADGQFHRSYAVESGTSLAEDCGVAG